MGAVAAIGQPRDVAGYALAGVRVLPADDEEKVRRCWHGLPQDVTLVLLTEAAARALGPARYERSVLTLVLPP